MDTYVIEGRIAPPTNGLTSALAAYSGTAVSVDQLVQAAAAVQDHYRRSGHPEISVVVGLETITNGIAPLVVFEGARPQIVVSGRRYLVSSNGVVMAGNESTTDPGSGSGEPTASPAAAARPEPAFEVNRYLVSGNSLLPRQTVAAAFTNAPGAFGTNVTFRRIESALTDLQQAYRARGYVTASVGLPQQKLTNATVRVQVTEGRLAGIHIVGNRYFSSNNILRALPSLQTGIVLNGLVFQSELNRANANQDRQIYLPVISPGATAGTSDLTLKIRDRLPLHAKLELNNQSSPGTPDLRVNLSAAYNNLWQAEHSAGVQYSFSPERYKTGDRWDFYDAPLVATYGAFYRLPLGAPQAVADVIAGNPGNFGYNEATRRFVLPPPSGQSELTLYASRATIDTGIETLARTNLLNIPGVRRITREDVQQDITVNDTLGLRATEPFSEAEDISSSFSEAVEFKSYSLTDLKTNSFILSEITYDPNGNRNPPVISRVNSVVPVRPKAIEYLPLSLAYNSTWRGPRATVSPGLSLSVNAWYSGSRGNLQSIVGSSRASGHWLTVDPSVAVDFTLHTNWVLSLRANGRWSSEPLISNEQFGAGGVGSVRGYREGEVFGDTGWHFSVEQKTPPCVVGIIHDLPLTVRGSVYLDGAEVFLLDPQPGQPGATALLGTGIGTVVSLGSYWEARFLFSEPLLDAGTATAGRPFFNFALTAQF